MPKRSVQAPPCQDLIACDCPGLIVDGAGRVCFRNPPAARLLARRRRTAGLLRGTGNANVSLILRTVGGERTLILVTPLAGGCRKVLFLRRPSSCESLPESLSAPREGEGIAERIRRFLGVICGREAVKVRTGKRRGRAATIFSFPDRVGIGKELFTLTDAFIRWGENGCDLRLFRRKGTCFLELLAPDPDELPAPFFQGGKRQRK